MKTQKGYKWLKQDMRSKNGNQKWEFDTWVKHEGELKLCENGLHASDNALDSLEYIYGDRWFIVEARGTILKDEDKFVASEMRLVKELDVKKILVPFACFAARRCLKFFEEKYPNDSRPRNAIEAAENYVKNPSEKNRAPARAARAAAEAAAGAAAKAAWTAARAATKAAVAAAWAAGDTATRAAAWAAAKAAWSAGAARAARAAEAASAGTAAWAAGDTATRAAALAAEKRCQMKELERLVKETL